MRLDYIYIYGWLIYSYSIIDKLSFDDICLSHIVGLTWPIAVPGRILKKILK